jgi:hypothetical protein
MRNFLTLGVFLGVVGVILVVVGLQERNLAAAASQEPEEISLKNLIARGPNGNPNIILKDFALCDNYVFKTRGTQWSSAWVPAVPAEAVPPGQARGGRPAAIQALIFTINAQGNRTYISVAASPACVPW